MRVTGSKVHRAWKCAASAVLPQSGTYRPDLEPARGRGQAIHAFLETVGNFFAVTRDLATARSTALAAAPADLVPLLEALELENLPTGLATEVSFAWNWLDGAARELGRNLPRRPDGGVDYDAVESTRPLCEFCQRRKDQCLAEGKAGWVICDVCRSRPAGVDWSCEIPCTIDVVGVANGGTGSRIMRRGYAGDYKSGHTKYPAPDMYGQTLLAALCVQQVYGCDDVVVELIFIHDNGGHHSVRRTVNEWDLSAFADQLQEAMEAVHGALWEMDTSGIAANEPGVTIPVEGPWCDYCDAYKDCPKKVALVKSIPQELVQLGIRPDRDSGELQLTPGALTIRNAGIAWEAIERIEAVLARAKEEICGIGAFEEIPLSDGRIIGRLITERRGLNGRIAAEVLEKRYGREERDRRIELSCTLAELRKAVVANIQQGQKIETKNGTGEFDKLVAEVERLGGIEVKTTDSVKPHVPKKKRLPG